MTRLGRLQLRDRLLKVARQRRDKLHPDLRDGMRKTEPLGVECMAADRKPGLHLAVILVVWIRLMWQTQRLDPAVGFVELVTDERVPDLGEMHTDLVVAAGGRIGADEGQALEPLHDLVARAGRTRIEGVATGRHENLAAG